MKRVPLSFAVLTFVCLAIFTLNPAMAENGSGVLDQMNTDFKDATVG